ncbi:pirin family protein [Thalassotalea mangrovi]|uniref:Pirin family protein n=1 Tax=Thalassotalea mangrovi TaxID=2572245 RepID=A0A4U1B591_9GAMM|nr:pirin family protein [Thalassotalea mangrovi]TKB45502.1 pirin family protein [Thalassotalea mangrovi]
MKYIRKAADRGTVNFGWLHSQHSFSFGHYYDPKHMGVSVLRVINDDIVQPGRGFDTHGHRDMEIISYVISGALEHKDSSGNIYTVPAGEVQRMSAGRGVMHSEYNASDKEAVNFLQIWIQPNVFGTQPGYQQKRIDQDGRLTPLVTPNGKDGSLTMQQDASLSRLRLDDGESFTLKVSDHTPNRVGYLHLVRGTVSANGEQFSAGDAFMTEAGDNLDVIGQGDEVEALWFDLPAI